MFVPTQGRGVFVCRWLWKQKGRAARIVIKQFMLQFYRSYLKST